MKLTYFIHNERGKGGGESESFRRRHLAKNNVDATTKWTQLNNMFLLVALIALMLAPSVSSADASGAFIGVSTNDTLLIQPPQGGSVSIVNFTELSSALVRVKNTEGELSSALVRVTSTEVKLNLTLSDLSSALVRVTSTEGEDLLSSTKSDLSSALVRMNRTEELFFSALSSALSRISTLESSTTTGPSPCKYKKNLNKKNLSLSLLISSFSFSMF